MYVSGTVVVISQQDWHISGVMIRGKSDVRYLVCRSDHEGRYSRVVYDFEFETKGSAKRHEVQLDMAGVEPAT